MIIFMIEREVILVVQLYNVFRISAGLHAVAGIREHCRMDIAVQDTLRGGEHALHLVVYNAVVGELAFRLFQLVVPAFLHEDFLLFSDIRVEDRVHVNVHEVLEISVVAACDRINGLIRVSHGV